MWTKHQRENRIRKRNREKNGRGFWISLEKFRRLIVSASQAPRRKVYLWKKLNFLFLAWRMNVWCIYTHGLLPCALLCCVGVGLYINTFPRHGYSMTFLFPSWTTSAAQTPLHLFGFPLLFLNLPFLLLFVCVLYYFHCFACSTSRDRSTRSVAYFSWLRSNKKYFSRRGSSEFKTFSTSIDTISYRVTNTRHPFKRIHA